MKRRRAIGLLGLSSVLSSCGRGRKPELQTYSSIAFGTEVHFQCHGVSEDLFQTVSKETTTRLAEIDRLFSLYNPESVICQLNRDGVLDRPPAEFLQLVRTAISFGEKTSGLFDITVQPLWDFRQQWKQASIPEREKLERDLWNQAVARVDFRQIEVSENRIAFGKPGMAITLNAIAQGHATDVIRKLLKQAGVENALINIGEYAALGTAPDGQPWPIQIRTKTGEAIPQTLPADKALAVSAGYGHTFDPEGRYHHIFRPTSGDNPKPEHTIVVTAPTATEADALSTTFAVATETEQAAILKSFPDALVKQYRPESRQSG